MADDAFDGRSVGEEGVGLGPAGLEDAVVVAVGALRVPVGILEVLGDGTGVGLVGVGVLAGVVVAFGGAGIQGVKIGEATDFLRGQRAGDCAFEREGEAVDEADVTILVLSSECAFELGVFGGGGVA